MRIWICLFPFLLLPLLLNSMADHVAECNALLRFSNSFTISKDASEDYCDYYSPTSYPKTASWKNDTDCCSWDGVTCHRSKDFVTGLELSCSWLRGPLHSNSTLFSLLNLRRLNLAGNDYMGSRISPKFGFFTRMAYLNLSTSGFSGPIPMEVISYLSSLTTLDMSSSFGVDDLLTIDDHSFSWLIQNLTQLRELALDLVNMSRISPISLTNISYSMTSLSFRGCYLRGIFPTDIFHLPNLCSLSLDWNTNLVGTLPETNWTSPLVSLDLSFTEFHGPIPTSLGNLTSMNSLDLSNSRFTGEVPPSLGNLHHLTRLALAGNNLGSTIDFEMFARLKNLQALSLGGNNLTVLLQTDGNCSFPSLQILALIDCNLTEFPYFLGSSPELTTLELPRNKISGQIPEWLWRVCRDTLEFLELSSNNLTGEISSSICQVNSLNYLSLSNNRLNGTIPICFGNLSRLFHLKLSQNLLQGPLPRSLANCTNLFQLDVSNNKFHGVIELPLSQQLSYLGLSNNNFTGQIPSSVCQLSSLHELSLSNNSLSGTIPRCLANCTSLWDLDVGNNGIHDTFPSWLINATRRLFSLDLQMNRFHGVIGDPFPRQLSSLRLSNNNFSGQLPINFLLNSSVSFLDMANNCFDGPLPIPLPNAAYYLLSNNKFHGDIPRQVCNATRLRIIDLSNNQLTGTVPHCFINFSASLSVLDLRANKFVGQIPEIFVPKAKLQTIRLSRNQLRGTLPQSLAHCEKLEVLDLSENELDGSFPYWLDTLPNLQVLALRSNRFRGPVDGSSRTHRPFPKLRIFDLSENKFCGPLPAKYLANLIAMKNEERGGLRYMGDSSYYQDSVVVQMKGLEIELVKILTVFTTIDFSSNFFEGEIPEVIGDLKALKGLNFSHNHLSGNIPSSLGNLTNLEWFDLSSNQLDGKIPRGLADLVWLSCLNLSDNQLVGPIPQSTQFSTFSHSFERNPGLCGRPLPKACGNNTQQGQPSTSHEEEEAESDNWIEWRAVPMGYTCGLAFGISVGYIVLETGRPRWLARMVERIGSGKTNRPKQNISRRNFSRRSPRGH